jgi:CheY-like chemotaxis protein
MERQVRHLTRLVDDLMDVARISRGKLELQREHVDLREVVGEAVKSCEPIIEKHEHELSLALGPSPVAVFADPVRIAQVVTNLLHNAARYTDPGGRITVRCEMRADRATLSVADTGRGIAPDMISRIFEMFVQARESGRGLGLGLTLVKQLVEMHAGAIDVRSDGAGRGSEFVVDLPLAVAAEAEAPLTVELASPPTNGSAPRLRVVIVDDDDDIRETVQLLLEDCGQDVEVAPDAATGFDLILQTEPDVAVLDIGLPDVDGYALARRLIERMGDMRPALVAVTGYGQAHDRVRALEAGFDVHLVKPASVECIQASVRSACEARDRRRRPPPKTSCEDEPCSIDARQITSG